MASFKDFAAYVSVNANKLYTRCLVEPKRTTDVEKPPVAKKSPLFPYTMDAACILQEIVFVAVDQKLSYNKRKIVPLPCTKK